MLIAYSAPLFSSTMELKRKKERKKTEAISKSPAEPLADEKLELLKEKPSAQTEEDQNTTSAVKEDEHEIL